MFLLEVGVVLIAVIAGSRLKGIGMGMMGGLGLLIFSFLFHLKPSMPPFNILMVIISVVTAAGAMEAAGGIDYLSFLCEKLIRRHPDYITFIGPLVAYLFTFLSGTSHVTYSILPIIASAAKEYNIKPSRPLAATVIASQQAILASPISAANAVLISLFNNYGLQLKDVLKIILPSTLCGALASTLIMHYLATRDKRTTQLKSFDMKEQTLSAAFTSKKFAMRSIIIFLIGVSFVVVTGLFNQLRPSWLINGNRVMMDMPFIVSISMLSICALITIFCKVKAPQITQGKIFLTGIEASVSILGIAWLGSTLFENEILHITSKANQYIQGSYWQFGVLLFFINLISSSQSVTLQMLLPVGIALGIPILKLIGLLPAVNSMFFIPSYPTMLAAINFDSTGSTHSGKFLLDHSFMLPGIVATIFSCFISYLLTTFI
jgi:anaerobic C4-dicarboxylate transporter DcuA